VTTPQPISRGHTGSARAVRTALRQASRSSLRGLEREIPDRRAPGPCLIAMAMLEFTRAGRTANHGRWGRGKPSAGNRKYEIGVVEVIGVQIILTGLVGSIAGGGRVSWRAGVPGAAFGVIFLAIGAASARRAASAAKRRGGPIIGARGR
jgi:hypothetical protein